MVVNGVNFPEDRIAEFCRRHGVRRFSLFGSILGASFDPESDVDVLVEFQPGVHIGLIGFAGLARELEAIIDRTVDLREPEDLSYLFRARLVREARLVHAA